MDKPSKTTKVRPLTYKQKKFIKAKAEGKTGVAAAQVAYPTADYNTARNLASENMAKPNIQEALQAEYEKQGLTLAAIVKPIADGVKANRVVQVEGDFYETVVPDHQVRVTAAKTAAMWLGIGKTADTPSGGIHFHNHTGEKKEGYSF